MKTEVAGISLTDFRDPIREALALYEGTTDGRYSLDIDRAAELGFVDGKLTARSQTPVVYRDQKIGDLFVLAFAPHDGTGDENTYKAHELEFEGVDAGAKVVPRSKEAAHSEVSFTIASKQVESQHDPRLFAGHLKVLGLVRPGVVGELGYLGQDKRVFDDILPDDDFLGRPAYATTMLTAGYRNPSRPMEMAQYGQGERFGDPHAIYNAYPDVVQIAGFLAITPETAQEHLNMLRSMGGRPFITNGDANL